MSETNLPKWIEDLKADFIEWSGGFGPEECEVDEITKYLEVSEIDEDDDRFGALWDLHNGELED